MFAAMLTIAGGIILAGLIVGAVAVVLGLVKVGIENLTKERIVWVIGLILIAWALYFVSK